MRQNDGSLPSGRTLFAIGIPPLCTEEALKNIFAVNGEVTQVYLRKRPGPCLADKEELCHSRVKGFKVGYVVFKEPSALESALKMDPSVSRFLSTQNCPITTGMKKWIEDYRSKWPDPTSLQNEIDDYMMKFDEHTAKKQEEAAAKRGEPDEEGWITVSRPKKGLKPSELSRSDLRRAKKKRKQKELLHFYQFQQRETKREREYDPLMSHKGIKLNMWLQKLHS